MIEKEALKILRRLDAAFQYTQKLNEDYVRKEYIEVLKTIPESDCNDIIDGMILFNRKELPLPGELLDAYRLIENDRKSYQKTIKPDQTCYVCEDRGYVIYKDEQFLEWCLYCTECDKGLEFQYSGKDNKNHKTNYLSQPVTKYFNVDDLRDQNMFKSHKIVPCPLDLKEKIRKMCEKR